MDVNGQIIILIHKWNNLIDTWSVFVIKEPIANLLLILVLNMPENEADNIRINQKFAKN